MSTLIRQALMTRNWIFLSLRENHCCLTTAKASWSSLAYSLIEADKVNRQKLPSVLMKFQHAHKLGQSCSCTFTQGVSREYGRSSVSSRLYENSLKTGSVQYQNLGSYGSYQSSPVQCQTRHITEDRKTTAVTIWTGLVHLKSSPLPALVLGFSGLIPFISAPTYMIATQLYIPDIVFAHVAYGAVILSFLGGVRWGFTLPEGSTERADWKNLGYSILPSLVAWTGLLCPLPVSLLTVMGGLAGAAYFDTMMQGYPPWFKALRFTLTFIAVLSLWTSFVCRFLLKKVANTENINASES